MQQSMPDSLPIAAQYGEGDVALVNAILRRCIGGCVRVELTELKLVRCEHLESLPTQAMVQLIFKVGGELLAIRMTQATLKLLFGTVCWAALDPAMQRLFIADQLSQILTQWTNTFDLVVSVEAINPIPDTAGKVDTAIIALELQAYQQPIGQVLLLASDKLNRQIATTIENSSLPLQRHTISLPCNLIAGYQQLREGDLSRLRTGTVILATNRSGQPIPAPSTLMPMLVEVALIDSPVCLANAETGRIRVTAPDVHSTAHETELTMNDFAKPTESSDTLDSMHLPLTFRLGQVHITMNDLQAISPGHVFSADIDPSQPKVDICLGNECVGHGRLVGIGDQLGVEVTAWSTSNE